MCIKVVAAALVGLVNSRVQEFRNSTSVFINIFRKENKYKKGTRVCRISEFLNGSLLVPLVLPRSAVLHIKSIS